MPKQTDLAYMDRYESFTDKLIKHHRDPDKYALTPEEDKHWQRINTADDLLRQLYPVKTVARLLMAKYINEGASIATAYRDIALAKKIFAFRNPDEKAYMERLMVEKLLKMLQRAMLNDDSRGVASISKEIREWMGKDADIDPKLLRGNTYVFNIGGKTVQLDSTEDVPSTILETIVNDGDIFELGDTDFISKINE